MKTKLRAVDLFCGGGGLSQGLINAGISVAAAYDHWQAAVDFYNKNIPGRHASVLDLGCEDEASEIIDQHHPDLIVGGPPCQDFSSAGKRDETGGRASLTLSYAQIVNRISPPFFIMENVERAVKTKTFSEAINLFKSGGYHLTVAVLDASLCGVPQKRKRVIVVGMKDGRDSALVPIFIRNQASKAMTLRDYFGDRLGVRYYYRHPRSYARRGVFSIDEPSPTIRGVNRPLPSGYPGHPGDPVSVKSYPVRALTTKERSLIQTFPEQWDISGSKSEIEQIVGNAVPVKLAEFVATAFLQYLDNKDIYKTQKIESNGQMLLFEQRAKYQGEKYGKTFSLPYSVPSYSPVSAK